MKGLSIALLGALLVAAPGGCLTAQTAAGQTPAPLPGDARRPAGEAGPADASDLNALQAQLAARPGWTEGWWKLSTLAYEADRFDIAAPALARVVGSAPEMGIAWDLLGLSEFELKRYGPARKHLDRAAQLADSNDPEVERVAAYHLALLCVRDGDFDRSRAILLKNFGAAPSAQVSYAFGLTALRVPLLPAEVDPSQEALIEAVGSVVAQQNAGLPAFAALLAQHTDVPFLADAYGLALEQAGQLQLAEAIFHKEAVGTPGSPVPWIAIARIEKMLGHTSEAHAAEVKAASLQQTSGAALQRALLERYQLRSAQGTDAGWTQAMQAYAAGKYGSAAEELKTWVSHHPEDGTAWAVLGLSEFAMQQYDNALLHLQRGESLGLQGDPGAIATAQYTAGVLLLRSGAFDPAAEILSAAHKLQPDDGRVTYALGLALLRRQELPKPGEGDALVQAAGQIELLLQQSRYDEAFPAFQLLLRRYPSTPLLHYAYGTALIALSQFDEAAAQMRAELQISPKSALPYARLASIALRQHMPAEALAPARQAIALSPSSAEAHYLLGRALLESGTGDEAVRELEQARTLNPGSPEVHFSLARAYARANREEAAAEERATFARLNDLSQAQKNGAGQQIYAGPRDGTSLSNTDPPRPPE